MDAPAPLVLASRSSARVKLLSDAGVLFSCDPADADEDSIKATMAQDGAGPIDVARALAHVKAETVAARHPGALVLGADQMLACEGDWFDKPADKAAAVAQLKRLRGRTHQLISAACVMQDGEVLWNFEETAALTMRDFSDDFVAEYIDRGGPEILESVGVYRLEGLGVQLFSKIDGTYFAILGLPLVPLLDFLRRQAILKT